MENIWVCKWFRCRILVQLSNVYYVVFYPNDNKLIFVKWTMFWCFMEKGWILWVVICGKYIYVWLRVMFKHEFLKVMILTLYAHIYVFIPDNELRLYKRVVSIKYLLRLVLISIMLCLCFILIGCVWMIIAYCE
jgi:hypothetical protein